MIKDLSIEGIISLSAFSIKEQLPKKINKINYFKKSLRYENKKTNQPFGTIYRINIEDLFLNFGNDDLLKLYLDNNKKLDNRLEN